MLYKNKNVIGRKTGNGKGNMRRNRKMYQLSLPLKHNKILLRDGMWNFLPVFFQSQKFILPSIRLMGLLLLWSFLSNCIFSVYV